VRGRGASRDAAVHQKGGIKTLWAQLSTEGKDKGGVNQTSHPVISRFGQRMGEERDALMEWHSLRTAASVFGMVKAVADLMFHMAHAVSEPFSVYNIEHNGQTSIESA
jgi:hypothetical protein